MTRYVMAGLAMTASVVLLFIASFRPPVPGDRPDGLGRPVPAQSVAADPELVPIRPASVGPTSDGQDSADAMAALQERIRQASQALASLESQVTQTRQDLASLQAQKTQVVPSQGAASQNAASQNAASQNAASQNAASQNAASQGAASRGAVATEAASTGAALPADQGAAPPQIGPGQPSPLGQTAPSISGGKPDAAVGRMDLADKPARRMASGTVPAQGASGLADPGAPATPMARPRPSDIRASDGTRTAETALPDGRQGRSGAPAVDDDATQAALNKLRRQSAQGAPAAVRPDVASEPHRVPTIERLADARAAVIEGRMEDARRSLQAAQVQLVFRAVGPNEEQPRVSQATGPISQALLALSTGDRGRAVIAIDQAVGALDVTARSRQFGSLPGGDGVMLPPVPRLGP